MRLFSKLTTILMVLWQLSAAVAQPLPEEVKNALDNGTRTFDGVPGIHYWQNHSHYSIDAELLVDKSILKASETVTYYNNSPDSLDKIVLRLYQDFYKKGNARSWNIGPVDITEGTTIEWLKINGVSVDLDDRKKVYRSATNMHITLDEELASGDSLSLEVAWQFQIPQKRWVRMGHYKNNVFFIAYWYPQIAVYDDIDGWDNLEYHGMTEYYNDFNTYEVSIKVPSGYMVWATGELQQADEHFQADILKRLDIARSSDDVINVIDTEDRKQKKVLKKRGKKSWTFVATEVPDFSFASSKDANWDATSLMVDSTTQRRVLVSAVYPDSTVNFQRVADWSRRSIAYMSYELPGVAFPYPQMTTFCNGRLSGGMETPMMANNADMIAEDYALGLTFHEILHNYFPFYMGTNERKYAWMDEGWAAYLPTGIMDELAPDSRYLARINGRFESVNGKERQSRLMDLSYQISDYTSYRTHAYTHSAMAYHMLRDALGDEVFKEALLEFMRRWHGKHPIPIDFFNTFNAVAAQDLSWFFNPWFFEKAKADLGIKKVTLDHKVVVENVGGLPLAVELNCSYEDGSHETQNKSVSVWQDGNQSIVFQLDKDKKIKSIQIGSDIIPDINDDNNQWDFE